jgi:hypothetical protein
MINFRASELPELRAKMLPWLEGKGDPDHSPADFFKSGSEHIPGMGMDPQRFAETLAWKVKLAQLFYVSADMSALVAHAATSLPDTDLHDDLIPSDIGLVIWAQRIGVCRGALWIRLPDGVAVFFVTDQEGDLEIGKLLDTPERHQKRIEHRAEWRQDLAKTKKTLRRVQFIAATRPNDAEAQDMLRKAEQLVEDAEKNLVKVNRDLPEAWQEARRGMGPLRSLWVNYARWHEPLTVDEDEESEGLTEWWLRGWEALVTTWTLMGQTITVTERQRPLRPHEERKLRRRGQDPTVTYVRLRQVRHVDHDPDSDTAREYHHRWLVSGHWRQQPYPSTGEVRPIWIAPHIRGPEGAPLLKREKVYTLVR